MIRKFFTKPNISYNFRAIPEGYRAVMFWVEVAAKGKTLWSVEDSITLNPDMLSTEAMSHLADLSQRCSAATAALTEYNRRLPIEEFKKLSLPQMHEQMGVHKSLMAELDAVRRELTACGREIATPEFVQYARATPMPLKPCDGDDRNDDRYYALYRETVWSSDRSLEPDYWKILADRLIEREEADLKAALAVEEPESGRERLSPEVRRAVWGRDQGKCARCGSRERLEFDHIIPVSRGDASTERNIELLCEACNRAKSDSID